MAYTAGLKVQKMRRAKLLYVFCKNSSLIVIDDEAFTMKRMSTPKPKHNGASSGPWRLAGHVLIGLCDIGI